MIIKTKEQIENKIKKIEKEYSEWEQMDYPNVESFIKCTGYEKEVLEYYELKAKLKTIEWVLKLINDIFDRKKVEKVVDLMVKEGISKEFIFNEKNFYKALELIEEELIEELGKKLNKTNER